MPAGYSEDGGAVGIVCQKCEYEWEYSGKLYQTTCPRCNRKTKTPLDDTYSAGDESVAKLEQRREELLRQLTDVQRKLDERR